MHDMNCNTHILSLVENMVQKEPQSFVHCGSFDHPDLHSLNNYKFLFFLVYQLKFYEFGMCSYLVRNLSRVRMVVMVVIFVMVSFCIWGGS